MADTANKPLAPSLTHEEFVADRLRFWQNATKFLTFGATALVVLLLILWWALV